MRAKTVREGMYIEQYRCVHQSKETYGAGSRHFEYIRLILGCCNFLNVLDYGCGKGVLADQLTEHSVATCSKYDPAISGIDKLPDRTFDAVINTDVLEHIPEPELDIALENFTALSPNAVLIPHLGKAREILPNGENAHCTIKTPAEWKALFSNYYKYVFMLAHDSQKHALFLCMQEHFRIDCIELAIEHIVRGKTKPDEVRMSLDAPFVTRAKSAAKLVLGEKGVGTVHRLLSFIRLK